jgi:hypothetical protein
MGRGFVPDDYRRENGDLSIIPPAMGEGVWLPQKRPAGNRFAVCRREEEAIV